MKELNREPIEQITHCNILSLIGKLDHPNDTQMNNMQNIEEVKEVHKQPEVYPLYSDIMQKQEQANHVDSPEEESKEKPKEKRKEKQRSKTPVSQQAQEASVDRSSFDYLT
eukprot:TRINITY_DN8299_c0_g1_i2.p1 TRINITY_DN8299_c0_g1~~TRINITY_DN8299_c0_g1_i2.p1  ORF type:complete len:111 (-),score=25.02 TRINITY_DN8299_c0_g1_i2:516-848(-)